VRQWGLLLAVAGGLVAGAFVGGAPAAPTVAPTFTLVASPTCDTKNGEKNVGRACVNPIATLADKWSYGDGNAKWDIPGQWVSTYEWTVPATVPAAGANLAMKLSATERIGGPNNRICPAMGAVSGFGLQGPQPQTIGFCAEAGGTVNQSKTLKMVASPAQPAGSKLYLTIGLQDGPHFTYTYQSSKQVGCKRRRAVPGTTAEDCTKAVAFIFTQGGRPENAPTRVLDVRIVGRGAGTADKKYDDEGNDTGDLEEKFTLNSARIVLERDYFTDSGKRATQRLVFGRPAESIIHEGGAVSNTILTELTLIASNDPACPEPAGAKERKAHLIISDRGAGPDFVLLTVLGCHHHQYFFRSAKRVKVAISIK
jgi:hypothetical protein